jgi:hypothetical protein
LSGLPVASEIVLELAADERGITHAVMVPKHELGSVRAAMTGALGSVRLSEAEGLSGHATRGLRLFVPPMTVLRTSELEAGAASLLAGLSGLRRGERVVVRWALAARRAPQPATPATHSRAPRAENRSWAQKIAGPGFAARGSVLVEAASTARARTLIEIVAGVYRSRRGALGGLRQTVEARGRSFSAMPAVGRRDGWLSAGELLALVAWPLGESVPASVGLGAARELHVGADVAREGRRIMLARDGGGERQVALTAEAAKHGLAVIGPTGSGKSEVLARGALDDIAHGFGGFVLCPKGGDLTASIIERVAPADAPRIVVIDPAAGDPPIGVNVLGVGDRDLAAELLSGVIRQATPETGIRTHLFLQLGLRTLSEVPGANLLDLGRLFSDRSFRVEAVSRLSDAVLLDQWRAFEALSPAAQVEVVQAPMARVMMVLSRPSVRGLLANPDPRLNVSQLLENKGWLLASISPGTLGEAGARIVAASLLFLIWSAMESRVTRPTAERHPIFVTIDELASVADIGFALPLMFERLRGLGGGLSVGVQTLGRIPDEVRSALLGNVASLVSFRASADESLRLSKELPGLGARDVQSLGRFEVAGRVGTGLGSAVTVVTGRTEPLPPATGQGARIRSLSAQRYGSRRPNDIAPADIEEAALGRGGREG